MKRHGVPLCENGGDVLTVSQPDASVERERRFVLKEKKDESDGPARLS
jgi:hypothetical protein